MPHATTKTRRRKAVLIDNVDWPDYRRFLKLFGERPGFRLTYDRGRLEIMSPRLEHDFPAEMLAAFVSVLIEETGQSVKYGGSTTLRRRKKQKGIEPDKCYWIANAPAMLHVKNLDLRIHPPPDLAIEVDVTSSSMNRMGNYAALAVPEVWRLDWPNLTFHLLAKTGKYRLSTHSRSFPQVTPADLLRFLNVSGHFDDLTVVRQFRAWVRSWAPPTP